MNKPPTQRFLRLCHMFLSYVSTWGANDESSKRSFQQRLGSHWYSKKTLSKIVIGGEGEGEDGKSEMTFFSPFPWPPTGCLSSSHQLLVEQRGFYSA